MATIKLSQIGNFLNGSVECWEFSEIDFILEREKLGLFCRIICFGSWAKPSPSWSLPLLYVLYWNQFSRDYNQTTNNYMGKRYFLKYFPVPKNCEKWVGMIFLYY